MRFHLLAKIVVFHPSNDHFRVMLRDVPRWGCCNDEISGRWERWVNHVYHTHQSYRGGGVCGGGVTVDYLVTVRGEKEGNIHPLFRTRDKCEV